MAWILHSHKVSYILSPAAISQRNGPSSQWYLPHEMALRMSFYNIAQPVGAMLSGALQGALSTNLDGVAGRSGWRWAFVINGSYVLLLCSQTSKLSQN